MSEILAAPVTIAPKSGLEKHGIGHLSASSVNLFAAEPALWVAQKLLGKRTPVGCAAHRGTAAEDGIVHGLVNPDADIAECQDIALAKYDVLAALSGDPRKAKEREAVPGIVACAIPELRQYGPPEEIQQRIEVRLDGVPVPFFGYLDLAWVRHGITMDLKSQLRLSSQISTAHARQVGLYLHGTNREGRVAYCTPQRIGVYRLEDAASHVEAVRQVALRMERFLSLFTSAEDAASVLVPDFDSFYWGDSITREMGREVYGF